MRGVRPRSSNSAGDARDRNSMSTSSALPPAAAMDKAVAPAVGEAAAAPAVPRSSTPARLSNRRLHIRRLPMAAAQGNGLRPRPSAAPASARAASNRAATCGRPTEAAATIGDDTFTATSVVLGGCGAARLSRSIRTMSSALASGAASAAMKRGVRPSRAVAFASAFRLQSHFVTSTFPALAASMSGVLPERSHASTSALRATIASTMAASPISAHAWMAIRPSAPSTMAGARASKSERVVARLPTAAADTSAAPRAASLTLQRSSASQSSVGPDAAASPKGVWPSALPWSTLARRSRSSSVIARFATPPSTDRSNAVPP
mmetsp:Transcript_14315/g.39527  ORF Transcript_14315/g.39527 Transcript_14315/m.39527 type:complete len:320 (+) Transcript_14315:568-1527(+)